MRKGLSTRTSHFEEVQPELGMATHKKLIEPARQSTNGVHINTLNTQTSVSPLPEDVEAAAARSVARVNAHHEAKTCFDTELMQLQVK